MRKIYIAGPFFNPAQVVIIKAIEDLLFQAGHNYYSPRLHSGSDKLTPEQRRDPKAWDPVFKSNEDNLYTSTLVLAVVEYALPESQNLAIIRELPDAVGATYWSPVVQGLEIPDSGTTWEMGAVRGYNHALSKWHSPIPIVAFHSQKTPDKLNLMLAKGAHGIISGWTQLAEFFDSERVTDQSKQVAESLDLSYEAAQAFNWSALSSHGKEIE